MIEKYNENGDIYVKSYSGDQFLSDKATLSLASPVFNDMFRNAHPNEEHEGLPVLPLSTPTHALRSILAILHRDDTSSDFVATLPENVDEFEKPETWDFLRAADQYHIKSVYDHIEMNFWRPAGAGMYTGLPSLPGGIMPCRAFDMPHYMLVFAAFITGYHAWSSDSPLQDRLQLLRHAFERTGLVVSNKEQSLLERRLCVEVLSAAVNAGVNGARNEAMSALIYTKRIVDALKAL